MKISPRVAGFLQALGLALYVISFALLAPRVGERIPQADPVFWGPIIFLLAFVTSALVCAVVAFGHPAYLVLEGERARAIRVVLWTAAWLAAFFAAVVIAALVV